MSDITGGEIEKRGSSQLVARTGSARRAMPQLLNISMPTGVSLSAYYADPSRLVTNQRVVIFVHGFCGNKDENGLFSSLAKYCLRRGIGVLRYDWRGLGDSSGDFTKAELDDHVSDFSSLVQWLRESVSAPGIRLSAVGFSLGAAIIGMALQRGVQMDSAAYISPAVRPRESMWPRYSNDEVWKQIREVGYYEKPSCHTRIGAPILRSMQTSDLGPDAFALKIPLLVCWGTNDTRVPAQHNLEILQHSSPKASSLAVLELVNATHSLKPGRKNWPIIGRLLADWLWQDRHESGVCWLTGSEVRKRPREVPVLHA